MNTIEGLVHARSKTFKTYQTWRDLAERARLALLARSNAPRTNEEAPAQAEVRPGGDWAVQGHSGGREETR